MVQLCILSVAVNIVYAAASITSGEFDPFTKPAMQKLFVSFFGPVCSSDPPFTMTYASKPCQRTTTMCQVVGYSWRLAWDDNPVNVRG